MNSRFKYDLQTVVEAILYIAERIKTANLHRVFKLMYFADKYHLQNYGQLIFGDEYVAMRDGPVPSRTYDALKIVRGDDLWPYGRIDKDTLAMLSGVFEVKDRQVVIPRRKPNLDYLSESERESLDVAISKYGKMTYGKLRKVSHDESYESADENNMISLSALTLGMEDRDDLLELLKDPIP